MSLVGRLLGRECGHCGGRLRLRVADHLAGSSGDVEVELTRFPYEACGCGRLAKWAFDPGTDFSTQLFFEGRVPFSVSSDRCSGCGAVLTERRPVELETQVHLRGFDPIGFRTRLRGFVCDRCGLQQAPEGAFDAGSVSGAGKADGALGLDDAVASIGLR